MLNQYRHTHLWLVIPFVLVTVGFLPSYWLQFTEAPWRHHLHGLSATLWFVILILQPYFVTRGHAERHRLFGMVALMLAGGVALTGLSVIPYNLVNEGLPETARYGLSFVDIVLVPGFVFAVIMALIHRKSVQDHARWMLSTVFWVMGPGVFRLAFFILIVSGAENLGPKVPWVLAATGMVNIVIMAVLMLRARQWHPAYVAACIGSTVMFFPMAVGDMQWWRSIADTLFTL